MKPDPLQLGFHNQGAIVVTLGGEFDSVPGLSAQAKELVTRLVEEGLKSYLGSFKPREAVQEVSYNDRHLRKTKRAFVNIYVSIDAYLNLEGSEQLADYVGDFLLVQAAAGAYRLMRRARAVEPFGAWEFQALADCLITQLIHEPREDWDIGDEEEVLHRIEHERLREKV